MRPCDARSKSLVDVPARAINQSDRPAERLTIAIICRFSGPMAAAAVWTSLHHDLKLRVVIIIFNEDTALRARRPGIGMRFRSPGAADPFASEASMSMIEKNWKPVFPR